MKHTFEIEEADRQAIIMGLLFLQMFRPGWAEHMQYVALTLGASDEMIRTFMTSARHDLTRWFQAAVAEAAEATDVEPELAPILAAGLADGLKESRGMPVADEKLTMQRLHQLSTEVAVSDRERASLKLALVELITLQAHYARLLNNYDGGARIEFKSAQAWIDRLTEIGKLPSGHGVTV